MNKYSYEILGKKGRIIGTFGDDFCTEEEMKIKAQGMFHGAKMLRQQVKVNVYCGGDIVYSVSF